MTTLVLSILNGSSSFLHTIRTTIKAWMSLNFGKIPLNTFQFDLTISMWSSCKIMIQKRLYRFNILDLTNTC